MKYDQALCTGKLRDGTSVYVQPSGGCVEVWDAAENEMVHICEWEDLIDLVDKIKARIKQADS